MEYSVDEAVAPDFVKCPLDISENDINSVFFFGCFFDGYGDCCIGASVSDESMLVRV